MKRVGVAIIGAGPRGLAVLERLSAQLARADVEAGFDIHVVDPGTPGQGIHRDTQPDHLLTNTTAGSTTAFVDASVTGAGPAWPGPCLRDWLQHAGYRTKDGCLVQSSDGDPIGDDTFIPRAVLGRYLNWAYRRFVERMPPQVEVRHHACRAVGIARRGDGRFEIALEQGTSLSADFVFLTTGHCGGGLSETEAAFERRVESLRSRNPKLAFFRVLDPIERLDDIPASARVAICGIGLTALDAVSMFTHGRGGTFSRVGEQTLRYHPSGDEPKMTLFSRQGLPPASKAIDQKSVGKAYVPRFFTTTFVERQRRRKSNGKIDWNDDLLPCLKKEMAFRLACQEPGEEQQRPDYEPSRDHIQAIERFLRPWHGVEIADRESHQAFVRRHLAHDIATSFVGNMADPFKAVTEMVRDLNDVVRDAVDYAGLTEASHREFLRDWCSINNRIAAGPPKERSMEMLALIEAGVLSIFEPSPTVALDEEGACFEITSDRLGYTRRGAFDVLIQARVGLLQPSTSSDPLLKSGLENGLLSRFENGGFAPSGIAIDRNLNVIGANGHAVRSCWAMGYVVEGAHYYTYVLPCPFANSRSLRDAGKAVAAMIAAAATLVDRRADRRPDLLEGLQASL